MRRLTVTASAVPFTTTGSRKMGDPTANEPNKKDDDGADTKAQGGREIIPLAAAAFVGALAGALIGSALG